MYNSRIDEILGQQSEPRHTHTSMRQVAVGRYTPGLGVRGVVLRLEEAAGRYVLLLPGDVQALLSTYELSAEDLDSMRPGQAINATVDRIEFDSHGFGHVVLSKDPQPIAY